VYLQVVRFKTQWVNFNNNLNGVQKPCRINLWLFLDYFLEKRNHQKDFYKFTDKYPINILNIC
jgi:hypothetical protein